MTCYKECEENNLPCLKKQCRYWLDYQEDLNCTIVAVNRNGNMTLREIGKRLSLSFVRIKQIQDAALTKLKLKIRNIN
jgi:DNA-directed RNA polymerase sigma subunit (sigma70/sigma32)